ncbi:Hypp629 [Branchiostoma lanceolatum]|uniref:Hypp629 protein n=1 Tax=Branchiostoma lanceolatum TaxID=7740 RepID=A0A8J9W4X5_BRALA|nr:Hypp629 [Branchiostoma lanceolatum]
MASLQQQEASSSYEPALTVNVKPTSKSRAGREKAVGEAGMHLKLLKLVLSMLLGLVVLACLSLSQLSAISLVRYLRPPKDNVEKCEPVSYSAGKPDRDRDVTALMVVYMLMLPYGVSLLRSLWNRAFQVSVPWPHPKAFLVGAFLSICEVTGLCVLTLRVMPSVTPALSVVLSNEAMKFAGLTDVCSSWVWIRAELYARFTIQHPATVSFVVNVTASFVGYILAWTACSVRMGFFGFALPAFLSTVVTGAIFTNQICTTTRFIHEDTCLMFLKEDFVWDVGIGLGLLLIQFFTTTWFVMRSPTIVMEHEAQLFWLPGYNSVFPAQWLLLSRKNRNTKGRDFTTRRKTKQNTHVYICTTMYHESEREMEQLLTSLRALAESQVGERTFESHIFFDGGCRQGQPSQWALQLFSVMGRTLQDENDTIIGAPPSTTRAPKLSRPTLPFPPTPPHHPL